MSKIKMRNFKCEKCGIEFEHEAYESINVSINPELRTKLLDKSIFDIECPLCHNKFNSDYPLLYQNMEKKFMVHGGGYVDLLKESEDLKNEKIKSESSDSDAKDYVHVGAISYSDLVSKVLALENGLDYRVAAMYEFLSGKDLFSKLDQKFEDREDLRLNASSFNEDETIGLCTSYSIINEKTKKMLPPIIIPFNKEFYDRVEKKYKSELDRMNTFVFNPLLASKLFLEDEKEVEKKLNNVLECAFIYSPFGADLACVNSFNNGKFHTGDIVTYYVRNLVLSGVIVKMAKYNEMSLPFYLKDMPKVGFKKTGIELDKALYPKKDENKDVVQNIIDNKKNRKSFFFNDLSKVKAFVKFISDMDEDDLLSAAIKKEINLEDSLDDLECTEIDDYLYCNVYLSEDELNLEKEKDGNKHKAITCSTLNSIAKYVFSRPEDFNGIIINPSTDKLVLEMNYLKSILVENVMEDPRALRKILIQMNKDERDYLGEGYDMFLQFTIFEGEYEERVNNIAKELSMNVKKVKEIINDTVEKMELIVFDNYS